MSKRKKTSSGGSSCSVSEAESEKKVRDWLANIGFEGRYFDNFIKKGADSLQMLLHVTPENLEDWGVKPLHADVIIKEIQKLGRQLTRDANYEERRGELYDQLSEIDFWGWRGVVSDWGEKIRRGQQVTGAFLRGQLNRDCVTEQAVKFIQLPCVHPLQNTSRKMDIIAISSSTPVLKVLDVMFPPMSPPENHCFVLNETTIIGNPATDTPETLGMSSTDVCVIRSFSSQAAAEEFVTFATSTITIRVKDQGGIETCFKVKRTTRLFKVFGAYAQRKGVAITSLRFILDGERIGDDPQDKSQIYPLTSITEELEDQDQIDCLLEQSGGCIAASIPATFSSHFYTPGGQFLKKSLTSLTSSEWKSHTKKKESSSLALSLGGNAALTNDAIPLWNISSGLNETQRNALIKCIDERYNKTMITTNSAENDYRITLSRHELISIIGQSATFNLEHHFQSKYDTIKMRRVTSIDTSMNDPKKNGNEKEGLCVAFHTDFSRRTMQISLNDETKYKGGLLLFATSNGFIVPSRIAGSYTIHNYKSVHGVTALTSGIRYSLFLCQTIATKEEEKEEENEEENEEEIDLVSNLTQQVFNEFVFFKNAVALLKNMNDNEILSVIQNEYQIWFERKGKEEDQKDQKNQKDQNSNYPSIVVEIIAKVHMIRPLVFAKASLMKCIVIGTNFVQDVRKFQTFMEKILEKYHDGEMNTCNVLIVQKSVCEYIQFLRVAGSMCGTNHIVEPSLIVDLVWHVHMQLFRGNVYCADSIRITGGIVNHEF